MAEFTVLDGNIKQPEVNIEIRWGDDPENIRFHFYAKKTTLNRIKYWLLCQFFPYRIERWE